MTLPADPVAPLPDARLRVLLAAADPDAGSTMAGWLATHHDVTLAADSRAALTALTAVPHDILLLDLRTSEDGLALLREASACCPGLDVIVMTDGSRLDDFIQPLRLGDVFDYLRKPFTAADLRCAVLRCRELRRLRAHNRRLREHLARGGPAGGLVGEGAAMGAVRASIARVATTDATVLITGASGTGKELAARAIHEASARSGGPFVTVSCGALPPTLLESELFGHVRGAFTGAERARRGCFEEAEGGTLFLDEAGTMDLGAQVRFLRAIGNREICRVGEDRPRHVDVRVVAATNADLAAMVAAGTFREDLYHRLNVFPIRMPDLAERTEDIPELATHLLAAYCDRIGRPRKKLDDRAMAKLVRHQWPGNVRELDNAIQRAVIMAGDEDVIESDDLLLAPAEADPQTVDLPPDGLDLSAYLDDLEMGLIHAALEHTGQNRQRAADLLGIQRTALVQKLRRQDERRAG